MLDVTPLLPTDASFPFRVGDVVVLRYDVLAEVGREQAGLPPTWCCVPAGTRGTLIGWRDRAIATDADAAARAIVELIGGERRLIVFVGEQHVERAPAPPPTVRRRPGERSRH